MGGGWGDGWRGREMIGYRAKATTILPCKIPIHDEVDTEELRIFVQAFVSK